MAVLELSSQSVPYVQYIRLKGVVVKDLGKDICKVQTHVWWTMSWAQGYYR